MCTCLPGLSVRIDTYSPRPLPPGDKPYRCQMCGNGFLTADKLQKHFKIHEREYEKKKAHK
jgi:hypothetical protein